MEKNFEILDAVYCPKTNRTYTIINRIGNKFMLQNLLDNSDYLWKTKEEMEKNWELILSI